MALRAVYFMSIILGDPVVGPSRGVGAFSVIVKLREHPFEALLNNTQQKAGGFPSVVYLIK